MGSSIPALFTKLQASAFNPRNAAMTAANPHLQLSPINAQACSVHTASGEHVGNLKLIGGVWKFKAIGYDASGQLVPGGGPLTEQHNTTFATPDEALVNAGLHFPHK